MSDRLSKKLKIQFFLASSYFLISGIQLLSVIADAEELDISYQFVSNRPLLETHLPLEGLKLLENTCQQKALELGRSRKHVVADVQMSRQLKGQILYQVKCTPQRANFRETISVQGAYTLRETISGLYHSFDHLHFDHQLHGPQLCQQFSTGLGTHLRTQSDTWITLDGGIRLLGSLECVWETPVTELNSPEGQMARQFLSSANALVYDSLGGTLNVKNIFLLRHHFFPNENQAQLSHLMGMELRADVQKIVNFQKRGKHLVLKSCLAAFDQGLFHSDLFLVHTTGFEISPQCAREMEGADQLRVRMMRQLAQSRIEYYRGPSQFFDGIDEPGHRLQYLHLRVLNFSPVTLKDRMTDEQFNSLLTHLSRFPALRGLNLTGAGLGNQKMANLIMALPHLQLKFLDLSSNDLDDIELIEFLAHYFLNLQILAVKGNLFSTGTLSRRMPFFQALSELITTFYEDPEDWGEVPQKIRIYPASDGPDIYLRRRVKSPYIL